MERLTDMQIVQRVAAGDSGLFGLLVERYSAPIFGLALRIVRDRTLAEEVTQETFIRAYEHIDTFRGACAPATWLYRIAYNRALKECRRRSFSRLDAVNEPAEEEPPASRYDEQTVARMRRALTRLSPEERALVTLFYEEERPVVQIAEITGMSAGNVKVRLHRLRQHIRQYMER